MGLDAHSVAELRFIKAGEAEIGLLERFLRDFERVDVPALVQYDFLFLVLRTLEIDRLLGVRAPRSNEEAVEPEPALRADLEADVPVQRQVEATTRVEFLAALDRDRSVAIEGAEQVEAGRAVLEPRAVVGEHFLARQLGVVALLGIDRQRPGDGLGLVAPRPGNGARPLEGVLAVREIEDARPCDDARRKAGAIFQDDVDRSTDALAVEVRRGRSNDFDPINDFGWNPVDEDRPVVPGARDGPSVDQDLREARPKSTQRRRIIFTDVAGKGDTGDALERVADGGWLELLEKLLPKGEFGRDGVGAVAIDARTDHDNVAQRPVVDRCQAFGRRDRGQPFRLRIAFSGRFGRRFLVGLRRLVRRLLSHRCLGSEQGRRKEKHLQSVQLAHHGLSPLSPLLLVTTKFMIEQKIPECNCFGISLAHCAGRR